MTVKKDGGDIDALTAATISSRAYAEAVAVAYEAFKVASGKQATAGDVATGATKQAEKGGENE
ncbi:MAG: FMN-binding protein, partial [Alistipes sp.]|nr:FMN-binding protein [Alistipes sp.]